MAWKVALHDVSSTNRLMETIKVVLAYSKYIDTFIVSKPSGSAAQYGVPEAGKKLYKAGIKFIVLPDISDYNIIKTETILQVSQNCKEELEKKIKTDSPLILLSGNENGFMKNELLNNARCIKIPSAERELPPEASLAVIINELIGY
jgi:SpoU rRNA methylase family enzyme